MAIFTVCVVNVFAESAYVVMDGQFNCTYQTFLFTEVITVVVTSTFLSYHNSSLALNLLDKQPKTLKPVFVSCSLLLVLTIVGCMASSLLINSLTLVLVYRSVCNLLSFMMTGYAHYKVRKVVQEAKELEANLGDAAKKSSSVHRYGKKVRQLFFVATGTLVAVGGLDFGLTVCNHKA